MELTTPTISVASVLSTQYPNITVGTYVYGAAYSSKFPLTFAATNYSKFFGSVPAGCRQQVGSIMGFSSQNFPTSPALANVEDIDETVLYYTVVAQPYSGVGTTFDYACTLTAHSIVNKYAFDPRHSLNDVRIVPLAVFPKDDMSEYCVTYSETKSLDTDVSIGVICMLLELTVSNIYSGYPGENFEHTRTTIVQCLGGGFLLKLGRIAGKLMKAAPSVFEAVSGAFEGQPDAPQKTEFMHAVIKHMFKMSRRNPTHFLFRMASNPSGVSHMSGHRLRV